MIASLAERGSSCAPARKRTLPRPYASFSRASPGAYEPRLDGFALRFIRCKVNQLIGRAGLTESDREDLFQEFVLDLLQRRRHYDPRTATWEAFVVVVCQNCAARIIERQQAQKRTFRREAGSLNRFLEGKNDPRLEQVATIPESQRTKHTGNSCRSAQEAWSLPHDVQQVLAEMPPTMRKVCQLLMRYTKAQTAQKLGISQGALYEILERILTRFEKAGLRDYLR